MLVHSNDDSVRGASAELSTVRNRPDLEIKNRVIVRDDKGIPLELHIVTPNVAGVAEHDFVVSDNSHFHVWALSISDDGVPSKLVGPLRSMHGYPPEND